jgi:hypothetical protein
VALAGCGLEHEIDADGGVVIVDDDPPVRAGLAMMLDGADGIVVVGEAVDGTQALTAVEPHAPDVVLMGIHGESARLARPHQARSDQPYAGRPARPRRRPRLSRTKDWFWSPKTLVRALCVLTV